MSNCSSIKNKKALDLVPLIVVEGKSDYNLLVSSNKFKQIPIFTTNGSALTNKQVIAKQVHLRKIYLFTDNDDAGIKIRARLRNWLTSICNNCSINIIDIYLPKQYKSVEDVELSVIEPLFDFSIQYQVSNLTWSQYLDLNLDRLVRRQILTTELSLPLMNHKRLYKTLCQFGFTYNQLIGYCPWV